jgi:hypothetical protein
MTVETNISYEQRRFNTECQRIADLLNVEFMDVHHWWQDSRRDWEEFYEEMKVIHERKHYEPH